MDQKEPISDFVMTKYMRSIVACCGYSFCSLAMTFTNKALLSSFELKYPLCLLMYQHIFTVVALFIAKSLGIIQYDPLKKKNVISWYPMNVLFVLMLLSGSYTLQYISVPMVTIFKNVATCMTAVGDYYLYSQPLTQEILSSILLMIGSSVIAGLTDLTFHPTGYSWMILNCIMTSAYVLYMKFAIKRTLLNEWGMVYYNNLLAIPTLLPILFISNELPAALSSFEFNMDWFTVLLIWSGVSSFFLSLTSFWAVKVTSPTTYSVVGSLNKIPLAILGHLFFASKMSNLGIVSVGVGLGSAMLYTYAKHLAMNNAKGKEMPV